jgi:hypothetical protein
MAWTVRRLSPPPEGTASIDCVSPAQPLQVTVENPATGAKETVQLCYDPTSGNPCNLLVQLTDAGFTPNDWAVECPS